MEGVDNPNLHDTERGGEQENKTCNIEFDDGSFVEIPYRQKNVDFPEHTIRETGGVKGYVRNEIIWENYDHVLKSIINLDYLRELSLFDTEIRSYLYQGSAPGTPEGKAILEKNQKEIKNTDKIDSTKSLRFFQQQLHMAMSVLNGGFGYSDRDKKDEKQLRIKLGEDKWQEIRQVVPKASELLRRIIDKLGNNFMDKTNIHVMQGVWSLPKEEASEMFKQKLLLQTIFDPVEMEKIHTNPENSRARDVWYEIYSLENPKDTLNGEINLLRGAETPNEFRSWLKEKSIFLFTRRGLSVSNSGFWSCDGRADKRLSYYCSGPFFGFGKENKAYINYLKSCFALIREIQSKIPVRIGTWENAQWIKLQKYRESIEGIMSCGRSYASGGENPHPLVPVIIGHPNIPELKWCHASFAYIPTKNGISVVEMIS